jgi:NAD(P)H-hydrate repair Nnr-like enzyme with NAD(P)H-hydrate dehydratase domain
MGTDDDARSVLAEVLATDLPVLVDADGLTMLAQAPDLARRRSAPTVLTPHDREFERFGTTIGDDRIGAVRKLVADADGTTYVNGTGTSWLATAGTGDVLSGITGALLATGLPAVEAAAVGAHLHGRAGELAAERGPLLAGDLVRRLPEAVARLHGYPQGGLRDSEA